MTTRSPVLLDAFAVWPERAGASPAAWRAARSWDGDPVLGSFVTPGEAARAVAAGDAAAFVALAERAEDPWAAGAALAGLAPALFPIARRWVRALGAAEAEVLTADLVTGCYLALRGTGPHDPARVVSRAWQGVHGERRTERARLARRVRIEAADSWPAGPGRSTIEVLLAQLVEAHQGHVISLAGASPTTCQHRMLGGGGRLIAEALHPRRGGRPRRPTR